MHKSTFLIHFRPRGEAVQVAGQPATELCRDQSIKTMEFAPIADFISQQGSFEESLPKRLDEADR